jgi:class 3 adenylate cyclase/streptogramin lyase
MKEIATGTVTFLFSDIEGSTRLLKTLGRETYSEVIAEHQRLMGQAVEESGGDAVDTQGDAFFVVFRNATDAIAAAVAAQRAHAAHEWPGGSEVRVRMGIHTGEASLGGERVHGLAVHRAARICAAGHGGQVLVSQTTHDLLADEERKLPDAILRNLGVHALKDLDRPLRLYQLAVEGLPTKFPPLRTPATGWRRKLASTRARLALAAAAAIVVGGIVAGVLATVSSDGPSSVAVKANSVAVIDPGSGRVVADVPVGVEPHRIVVGEQVAAIINGADNTVAQIDLEKLTVTRTIGLTEPTDLWLDGDTIWALQPSIGTVSRIDPDGRVTHVKVWSRPASGCTIAAGAGKTWASRQDRVVEIEQETNSVVRTFRLPPPESIGAETCIQLNYRDGTLWALRLPDATVGRVDLASGSLLPVAELDLDVGGWDVGLGSLWVAQYEGGTLTRIDLTTGQMRSKIPIGENGGWVLAGDERVWVLDRFRGRVVEVDPESGAVAGAIELGHVLCCVAESGGRLFVTAQTPLPKP